MLKKEQTYTRLIKFFMTQEAELAWLRDYTGLDVSKLTRLAVDQLYEKMTKIADEESETQPTN